MKNQVSTYLRRGFTFLEMMVAIAILGLVAVITLPNLTEAFSGAKVGTAAGLQGNIQSSYDQWASLGAGHMTAPSDQLTLGLLTLLTGTASSATSLVNNSVTINGDPNGIFEPLATAPVPSSIRMKMPKGLPVLQTVTGFGSPVYLYGGNFVIQFSANNSVRAGTWTVTALP